MQVYGIRNQVDMTWWSRNRWGTHRSLPDLFQSPDKANYQLTEGKVAWMAQRYPQEYKPELVLLDLNVRHAI